MSRLIHKKWWPCEVLEARDLKFCMGPYFTYTHAVQKYRLDLKTFWKNGTAYYLITFPRLAIIGSIFRAFENFHKNTLINVSVHNAVNILKIKQNIIKGAFLSPLGSEKDHPPCWRWQEWRESKPGAKVTELPTCTWILTGIPPVWMGELPRYIWSSFII